LAGEGLGGFLARDDGLEHLAPLGRFEAGAVGGVGVLDVALAHLHARHQALGVQGGQGNLAIFGRREGGGVVLVEAGQLGVGGRLGLGGVGEVQLDERGGALLGLPGEQGAGQRIRQGGARAHGAGQLLPRQVAAQ
jgi:hypothetical protein